MPESSARPRRNPPLVLSFIQCSDPIRHSFIYFWSCFSKAVLRSTSLSLVNLVLGTLALKWPLKNSVDNYIGISDRLRLSCKYIKNAIINIYLSKLVWTKVLLNTNTQYPFISFEQRTVIQQCAVTAQISTVSSRTFDWKFKENVAYVNFSFG